MKKILSFLVVGSFLGLVGCTALHEMESRDTEKNLAASGFRVVSADTAERLESLSRLQAYHVNRKIRNGTVYYLYPDPKRSLLFVGNQDAYTRYEAFKTKEEIANENEMAADSMGGWGWGDWGVWGPVW